MRHVIALTGPKGSGKDTVADIIQRQYAHQYYAVQRIAFADPIKKVIQHIFDLNPHSLDQYDLFKRTNLTYQLPGHLTHSVEGRHVVREIGMLMRGYDEDQFVRYVTSQINSATHDKERISVVTDMRFENEYQAMRQLGAKVVKIVRPDHHYDGHATEQGFNDDAVDYVIHNTGSFINLQNSVIEMVDQFIEEWK